MDLDQVAREGGKEGGREGGVEGATLWFFLALSLSVLCEDKVMRKRLRRSWEHLFTYCTFQPKKEVLQPHFKRNSEIKSELALEDPADVPIHKEENFMPDLMSEADRQAKLGLSFLCQLNPAVESYESFCL